MLSSRGTGQPSPCSRGSFTLQMKKNEPSLNSWIPCCQSHVSVHFHPNLIPACNLSIKRISACSSCLLHHGSVEPKPRGLSRFTISNNSTLICMFHPTLHTRSSSPMISTATPNHSCGSLVFDVSLRQRRGKTSWIVRERKGRKITFSLYTGGEKFNTVQTPRALRCLNFRRTTKKAPLQIQKALRKLRGFL